MTIRNRILGVLVAAGVVLAACGDDDAARTTDTASTDAAETTDAASATPVGSSAATPASAPTSSPAADSTVPAGDCGDGGRLTMGVYSETAGLDPTVSTGGGVTGATELAAIYDTLMSYDEEAGTWEPRLAESLEPNGDATVWTMTLRDGVTFGNGDPFTAAAVKVSVERHQAETTQIRSRGLSASITEVEALDEHTVVFHLSESWGSFPYLLAGEVGMIVNPAVVDELGAEEFSMLPAGGGAGPYEPVRFVPGEELVMEAKDDYWGGPLCIEELRFVAIAGAEGTYDAFRNEELDVAFLRGPRVIAEAKEANVQSHSELLSAGAVMLINSGAGKSNPPTADVRLRRAIAHAVDPALIDERAYSGAGLPTTAVVHPDSRYYAGLEGPAHDPQLATQLVEEVKADGTWDGTITLACDNTWTDEALSVEAQLEAVGFDVDADVTSTVADRIQRVIVDQDYDVACWGMSLAESSPWAGLSRNVGSAAAAGRTGYANDDMDAALTELKVAQSFEEEQAAMAKVQEVWNDTIPTIVTAATEEVIIWQDDVHGLDFNQETVVFFDAASLG